MEACLTNPDQEDLRERSFHLAQPVRLVAGAISNGLLSFFMPKEDLTTPSSGIGPRVPAEAIGEFGMAPFHRRPDSDYIAFPIWIDTFKGMTQLLDRDRMVQVMRDAVVPWALGYGDPLAGRS